jgi:hypothetical protein
MALPKGDPFTILATSNLGRKMFWKVLHRNEHVCQCKSSTWLFILWRMMAHLARMLLLDFEG